MPILVGLLIVASVAIFDGDKRQDSMVDIHPPSVITLPADRVINLEGLVAPMSRFSLFSDKFFSASMFLLNFPEKIKDNKVFIRINSPGGSGTEMEIISDKIDQLKDNNVKVICLVDGMAASAATVILSHCSERYATTSSNILWHSVAVGGISRINQFVAEELAAVFKEMNLKSWALTRQWFDPNYFDQNFKAETLINALEVEKESKGGFIRTFDRLVLTNQDNQNNKQDKREQ